MEVEELVATFVLLVVESSHLLTKEQQNSSNSFAQQPQFLVVKPLLHKSSPRAFDTRNAINKKLVHFSIAIACNSNSSATTGKIYDTFLACFMQPKLLDTLDLVDPRLSNLSNVLGCYALL